MKPYTISSTACFAFVALGSFVSRHMGWYNSYWFTDIVLHTVSGVAFSLIWLGIARRSANLISLLGGVSFAVFGSVLWEFWEFGGWKLIGRLTPFYVPQLADTLGDISCGMIGGLLIALIVVLKRR
jgi:hypothetical protein